MVGQTGQKKEVLKLKNKLEINKPLLVYPLVTADNLF